MAIALGAAFLNAISKTALIFDDIPATAGNLIDVPVRKSHPDAQAHEIPSQHKGKHMSEGEFYRNAAFASLGPKAIIGMTLGTLAAGLGFIGLSSVLTVGLVPLALWICGKSAEKEEAEEQEKPSGEYKPSLIDRLTRLTPGVKKFHDRLPHGHRRILGETIKMDVALEMEMMTLAAVALGASGLAATGIVGFLATVALVPIVAITATSIVWSTAFGVRKLRHAIAKNQRAIESGARQKKPIDKVLNYIDNKIEPALGIIGKVALMAIGGALIVDQALIPLAHMLLPHVAVGAISAFEALPALVQTALCLPLGYSIGRFIYNPHIAPALGAIGRFAKKAIGHSKKEEAAPKSAPTPAVDLAPASKVGVLKQLRATFSSGHNPPPGAQEPQNGQITPPKHTI